MKIAKNPNTKLAQIIIEYLIEYGITDFIISPGSRSTPLVLEIDSHKEVNSHVIVDERGAGFFALGLSKSTSRIPVLVCTSGSALANYFPSVIEAFQSELPLLIISSDRPERLFNTGANQTINQLDFYGKYAHWFYHFSSSSSNNSDRTIKKILHKGFKSLANGPLHINISFDEPLFNSNDLSRKRKKIIPHSKKPFIIEEVTSSINFLKVNKQIKSCKKLLLVIGEIPLIQIEEKKSILKFINNFKGDIYIDILSSLRGRCKKKYLSELFLNGCLENEIKYDGIFHIGAKIISKRLNLLIEKTSLKEYIILNNFTKDYNPTNKVTLKIKSDYKNLKYIELPKVKNLQKGYTIEKYNKNATSFFQNKVDSTNSEPLIWNTLQNNIKKMTTVFLGNSLSVRYGDLFLHNKYIQSIYANRGASGIDGNLATSIAIAHSSSTPTIAIIGDITILHDLSSFQILKNTSCSILIIIINNKGGGIFSRLPIHREKKQFEKYFETSHNLSFKKISKMFDIEYHNPKTINSFSRLLKNYFNDFKNRKLIIELNSDSKKSKTEMEKYIKYTLR